MQSILALIKSLIEKILALFRRREADPIDVEPYPEGPTMVCYYGCPNSKKAQKLQLNKTVCK